MKGKIRVFVLNIGLFCMLFGVFSFVNAQNVTKQKEIKYNEFDFKMLTLIRADSISKARFSLDSLLKVVGKSDKRFMVSYNFNYGWIFNNGTNYKRSIDFLIKASHLSNELTENPLKREIETILLRGFRDSKNHHKVDSLFLEIIKNKKQFKEGIVFFNYNDYMVSMLARKSFKEILPFIEGGIKEINDYDYSQVTPDRAVIIKKVLLSEYKIHLAKALIETKTDYNRAFKILNGLEKDSLNYVARERDLYLKQISEYKAKYFYDYQKNIDSLNKYQNLALVYESKNITKIKRRASKAKDFIYEMAITKKELENLTLIHDKDQQLNEGYFYITVLISVLLLMALIFILYVYNSSKEIKLKNRDLQSKNEILSDINTERSQFYSVVSHELRTPIYTIKGLSELINSTENPSQRKEYMKTLMFSINHLQALVNNVLEFSRFSLGKVGLNKDVFCFRDMLTDIGNSFEQEFVNNNIRYSLEFDDCKDTIINGDRLKLSQIFINLISNAIKFTPNGDIVVKVKKLPGTANKLNFKVTIKDTGIGISKVKLPHLFDGFSGSKHINENKGGAGLGLFIVKKILGDLFNTKIKVTSELGKGTKFCFQLELAKPVSDSTVNIIPDKILNGLNMLVVDDNKVNLMITKKNLEKLGVQCVAVDNGYDAVTLVKDNKFDLVFMDVHMPGKNGIETVRDIRVFNTKVKIVALTAVDLENAIEEIYNSGMNGVITKPYKKEDFVLKIKNILDGSISVSA